VQSPTGFYNEGLEGKAVCTGRVYKSRKPSPLKGTKKKLPGADTAADRFIYAVKQSKPAYPEEKQHATFFNNMIPIREDGSKTDYSLKSLRQGCKLYDGLVEKGYWYGQGKGKDCMFALMDKYWFGVVEKEGIELMGYCGGIRSAEDSE
jgi:hypothetical protein